MKKINKIGFIFGTRPEAIKLAPLINLFKREFNDRVICISTGQHKELLHDALAPFNITVDHDLEIMTEKQSLSKILNASSAGLEALFEKHLFDLIYVHGDTSTTLAAALTAFYHKVPVAHVEAGLRTYNKFSPWPEEVNRRMVACLADLNFTPTETAKKNLISEGIKASTIHNAGNTVIDSVRYISDQIDKNAEFKGKFDKKYSFIQEAKKIILVTVHRRENFGDGILRICDALAEISLNPDVQIVMPVHPNPNIFKIVKSKLSEHENIKLISPVQYDEFVYLMKHAFLILSDSGGIQEEAPELNVPVLVLRDTTERPEAIKAGGAMLIGTDTRRIIDSVSLLFTDGRVYDNMARAKNPYGDGNSAKKILAMTKLYLGY